MDCCYPFAVILPVASKGLGSKIFHSLERVANDLRNNQSKIVPIYVYIGIDENDSVLSGAVNNEEVTRIFTDLKILIKEFPPSRPARICEIWRDLAQAGYEDGCKYFLLYGDDVTIEIKSGKKWTEVVHQHFLDRSNRFGCVALNDQTSPGFPTFPIVTEMHLEIFGAGNIVPSKFVNQDGDPYLWELYRRFGASRFLPEVRLRNGIGGMQLTDNSTFIEPRYEREHIDWRSEILQRGVDRVAEWVQEQKRISVTPHIVLDIIVPTFRVLLKFLLPIIQLEPPNGCDVKVIVIVDNPSADIGWLRDLESSNVMLGKLRIQKNLVNLGAPRTRNVGLTESAADWVLFLDDDLFPDPKLLHHYCKAIKDHGRDFDGFVGVTRLPNDKDADGISIFGAGVHLSGVSFFWTCAATNRITPWGITANLLFNRACRNRRDTNDPTNNMKLRFDPAFIKTGGGEDIDFCLRLFKQPLKCVADAVCDHPWWNDGKRCYQHFYNWAIGDSLLIEKFPHFSYMNFPNVVEYCWLMAVLHIGGFALWGGLSIFNRFMICLPVVLATDCALDIIKHCLYSEEREKLPKVVGIFRVLASIEAFIIKNSSELGHLLGPMLRGDFFKVGKKFDWFCGTFPGYIAKERLEAGLRLVAFILVSAMIYMKVK